MTIKIIFLFLYISFCNTNPIGNNLNLELIQVLFRHGARTPIDCEAKLLSNCNESLYEPWGYGQLTDQGMQQEYRIGEILRERYSDFLQEAYKPEHVYAYASGVGRTKASLELVLAALYPPSGKYIWNSDLNWIPIPTHSNPRPLDILIKSRNCPKYIQHLQQILDSNEMKETVAEHDDIRKRLEEIYGKAFNFGDIFCAYNAIVVNKNLNLTLPNWYSDAIFSKLSKAAKFYLNALSYTPTLRRLNGGTLVRRFLENINKSNLKLNRRKIYLYSAHDKTLHAFIKAHNISLTKQPDYGSSIILEKYRDENNKFYVKLLFWTGEPKELSILKVENCTDICPLDEYLKIIQPILPSDDEMLCLFTNLQPKNIEKILNTDLAAIDD